MPIPTERVKLNLIFVKKEKETNKKCDLALLNELDRTAKLLVRRDLELTRVNSELDEKIKKLEEDEEKLKEVNDILEIRLQARTRQLRENIVNLDEQVKERTKKLESSQKALINILKDFQEARNRAVKEREKTFAIISNFSDGLLIFDDKNTLIVVNKQTSKVLGIKEKDFINKTSLDLSRADAFRSLIDIIGVQVHEVFRKEFQAREDLILEVSVAPISINEEKIGKFVILHDITREKTVQKLKTEFVSIAAHQLRTPLSAIKWTLMALLEGDLGELSKEQRQYLEKTNLSNERMINLVDDLLNLSRIEEGRYIQKNVFSKFEGLVQKIVDSLQMKAKQKNVKLNFEKPKNLPEILMDKEKISLVVQNLIENAINYSLQGGEAFVSVDKNADRQEVEFRIKDFGIGIPESQQKRIFTKFFRAENAVKAETVGSGLGLFINKNIIESHGGRIWFESKEGQGTTFHFTLPIKAKVE